jgi:tRNA G10  N-methylase Trm11
LNVCLVGQEGHETQLGGRYSVASVRGHPGKMLPALARRLVEEYTRPKDLVLDPLSGIGTIGLEAIRLGRRYLGVELEAQFVAWQRENLAAARVNGAPGLFAVRQGDVRELPALLVHDPALMPPVDAVLTSPPYADRLRRRDGPPSALLRDLAATKPLHAVFGASYGSGPENIGNLAAAASM